MRLSLSLLVMADVFRQGDSSEAWNMTQGYKLISREEPALQSEALQSGKTYELDATDGAQADTDVFKPCVLHIPQRTGPGAAATQGQLLEPCTGSENVVQVRLAVSHLL
jgi:hypothetical protein